MKTSANAIKKLEEVSERISHEFLLNGTGLHKSTIEDIRLYLCQDTRYMVERVIKYLKGEINSRQI